ncbi:hypothetical protein Q9L58_010942, partial [Maublancomyces gigas]
MAMGYRESQLDQKLRKWFKNDLSKALLRRLALVEGSMRGITPFSLEFEYPIAAFAGVNGAGKSTLLAMIA